MAHSSALLKLSTPLVLLLLLHFPPTLASRDAPASSDDLVRSSCVHASYPDICVRTLSTYPDPPKTKRELAQASVKVSLGRARKLSEYLAEQREESSKRREKAALKDCLEQMGDSIDELERTLSELEHLREGSFRFQMSNAETWVSAALSDDETCLDGLSEAAGKGRVRDEVKKRIVGVAKVTSNALYLINQLDSKRG
uniref:Pectinesterase inhibitor domain-containing protein n=1 Tax=Kalanchoe fedtschenkoi TaxID=63787 RepID=A0A7N0VB09_KALFE